MSSKQTLAELTSPCNRATIQQRMHTCRKCLKTACHPLSTTDLGGTGRHQLRQASCETQPEGYWSKSTEVRFSLCTMQDTIRQRPDSEILLTCCKGSAPRRSKTRLPLHHTKQKHAMHQSTTLDANINSITHKNQPLNARIALQSLSQRTSACVSYFVAGL